MNLSYNTGVTQIDFNDADEISARQQEYSATPDSTKKFILKPGQQVVGVYGKLKRNSDISWFNFLLAKPEWKQMGPNALYL